jgi:PKD repeat protein
MHPFLYKRHLIIRKANLSLVLVLIFLFFIASTRIVSTYAQTPPHADFSYSPSAPRVGETVTFDAYDLSYDDDGYGEITSYNWDFGDGNSSNVPITSHVYTAVGTYTVKLTVFDNESLTDTATKVFDVLPPPKYENDVTSPVADAQTIDQEVEIYERVTFNGGYSSDDVGIARYEWNFGDGTIRTGVIAHHEYELEGSYRVTLTVTDFAGNSATDFVEITVGEPAAPFPLWVLAPVIGAILGIATVLVYLNRRKSKRKVIKPAEPMIEEEPIEIPPPAKRIEKEALKPPEETPPQRVKELPKLSAKCQDTIAFLNSFIEDPSRTNDRKAWKSFREFITIAEQIEDEYAELIEIRNKLAILRRKRNEYRSAGLDELADKVEGDIQSNYVDSIRIIKEIQEKLPQLGG